MKQLKKDSDKIADNGKEGNQKITLWENRKNQCGWIETCEGVVYETSARFTELLEAVLVK